jgi:hypothetical protein
MMAPEARTNVDRHARRSGGDSGHRAVSVELARLACRKDEDQMVGRVGIEPTTSGLKVRCSTD